MSLKKIESAVIFDCDGVMFDSRRANINYYNYLLSCFNQPPMTNAKIDFVHAYTADDSVRHIFEGTPFLEKAMALKAKVDYTPFIHDMVVEPGLRELLNELKPYYGLGVATNRSTTIGKVLQYHGLTGFFDIVVSSLDVRNPKPHPESLLKILDFFNISPGKALYIGDSILDYRSARSAGVIFTAYKNRDLDADYHVDSMMEILDIVKVRE
jgi:HAD superfamily hydrolase (TIGR01509 family)